MGGPYPSPHTAPLNAGDHHLAGIYDGHHIRLYVDGILAAERQPLAAPFNRRTCP